MQAEHSAADDVQVFDEQALSAALRGSLMPRCWLVGARRLKAVLLVHEALAIATVCDAVEALVHVQACRPDVERGLDFWDVVQHLASRRTLRCEAVVCHAEPDPAELGERRWFLAPREVDV
jgi:hypothetical protein